MVVEIKTADREKYIYIILENIFGGEKYEADF